MTESGKTGQRSLVTGAQQGIGAEAAVALAANGGKVAINWLDDLAAAEQVARRVRDAGGEAVLLQGDIGSADACKALVDDTVAALGGLDVLVNNAGIFPATPPLDITEDAWDRVMAVNSKAAFFCAQAAARQMIAQGTGGNIVSIASVVFDTGAPVGTHYVASKGAVVAITRSLAASLGQHGIRVNAISPGLIDTAQPRGHMTQEQFDQTQTRVPLGRIGEAAEIADVISFLASDAARYITGQTLLVNGGIVMG